MFIFPIFSTLKVSNFTTETFILSTCKILIIHWTISFWPQKNRYKMIGYRNSTEAWKFFEPQKFLFFENFRIFVKFCENFENFKQRWNEKFFLPRLGNFPVLVEKNFSLLYRRSIYLEILQVINLFYRTTKMAFSKHCTKMNKFYCHLCFPESTTKCVLALNVDKGHKREVIWNVFKPIDKYWLHICRKNVNMQGHLDYWYFLGCNHHREITTTCKALTLNHLSL